MNQTTITVVGNVATEPALRVTGNGHRLVTFRLATSARRRDKASGEWCDADKVFWTITCWRSRAENALSSLHKGDPVVVHGRIKDASYEDKDGTRRSGVEIEADAFGHDLSRGISRFARVSSPVPDTDTPAAGAADEGQASSPAAA